MHHRRCRGSDGEAVDLRRALADRVARSCQGQLDAIEHLTLVPVRSAPFEQEPRRKRPHPQARPERGSQLDLHPVQRHGDEHRRNGKRRPTERAQHEDGLLSREGAGVTGGRQRGKEHRRVWKEDGVSSDLAAQPRCRRREPGGRPGLQRARVGDRRRRGQSEPGDQREQSGLQHGPKRLHGDGEARPDECHPERQREDQLPRGEVVGERLVGSRQDEEQRQPHEGEHTEGDEPALAPTPQGDHARERERDEEHEDGPAPTREPAETPAEDRGRTAWGDDALPSRGSGREATGKAEIQEQERHQRAPGEDDGNGGANRPGTPHQERDDHLRG